MKIYIYFFSAVLIIRFNLNGGFAPPKMCFQQTFTTFTIVAIFQRWKVRMEFLPLLLTSSFYNLLVSADSHSTSSSLSTYSFSSSSSIFDPVVVIGSSCVLEAYNLTSGSLDQVAHYISLLSGWWDIYITKTECPSQYRLQRPSSWVTNYWPGDLRCMRQVLWGGWRGLGQVQVGWAKMVVGQNANRTKCQPDKMPT